MLRDWGSWDAGFNAVTADMRRKLVDDHSRPRIARVRADAGQRHVFGRGGGQHARPARRPLLVLINGAYGTRLAKLTKMMGRRLSTFETAEDVPTTPQDVDRLLDGGSVDHACRADPLRDVDRAS